jgi:uridine kinase
MDNTQVINKICNMIEKKRHGQQASLFISICGAAGLGKTTMASQIKDELLTRDEISSVSLVPLDSFLLDRSERIFKNLSGYDIKANNISKAIQCLNNLKAGREQALHPYNHATGKHEEKGIAVCPAQIVIVEGIHSLYPALLPLYEMKIFLYATPENTNELRFLTDVRERMYTPSEAFEHVQSESIAYTAQVLHYATFADVHVTVDAYWSCCIEE